LAEFSDAERYLKQALDIAVEIKDAELEAASRERLGGVLRTLRRWPESLDQYIQAANLRKGLATAIPPLRNARYIAMALGLNDQVETLRTRGKNLLDIYPSEASYLREDEKMMAAEFYSAARYEQTQDQIAKFKKLHGPDEDLQILQHLVEIRQHHVEPALASLQTLIDGLFKDRELAEVAETRLDVAEALVSLKRSTARPTAFRLAGEALAFFNPHQIWESVWRCHAVAAVSAPDQTRRDEHRARMATAQQKLRDSWPPELYTSYAATPRTQKLRDLLL
jgi:hypothetical protein